MSRKHGKALGLSRRSLWVWLALMCAGTGCGPSRTLNAAGSLQTQSSATVAPRPVGDFLLLRKDGGRIEGRDGALTAERLTGTTADGKQLDVLRDDIKTLYRKEESLAASRTLIGAGTGLLTSGLIVLQFRLQDPLLFRSTSALPVSAAIMGGSALLGALIGLAAGAGENRWSVEPMVTPDQEYSVHLSLAL